jgi:hypothetical protein
MGGVEFGERLLGWIGGKGGGGGCGEAAEKRDLGGGKGVGG